MLFDSYHPPQTQALTHRLPVISYFLFIFIFKTITRENLDFISLIHVDTRNILLVFFKANYKACVPYVNYGDFCLPNTVDKY